MRRLQNSFYKQSEEKISNPFKTFVFMLQHRIGIQPTPLSISRKDTKSVYYFHAAAVVIFILPPSIYVYKSVI